MATVKVLQESGPIIISENGHEYRYDVARSQTTVDDGELGMFLRNVPGSAVVTDAPARSTASTSSEK